MANPFQGDDVDPFSGARDEEGNVKRKVSFASAFREARRNGDSTFTWNGKKYTTEMAKPKSKTKTSKSSDEPISKAEFLKMEAEDKEKEAAKDSSGKYSPDIANRMAIAKDAANTRSSQEGQFGSFSKGGKVKGSSASRRGDGCAVRGKTKGRMV